MKWYEDPVYIKMCEKAEEIQKYRNSLKIGDYVARFWRKENSGGQGGSAGEGIVNWTGGSSHTIIRDSWGHYRDEAVWLPRQDQLQEIYLKYKAEEIEKECKDKREKELCYKKQLDWMCSSFSRFQKVDTLQFDDLYPLQFTSMEQLWLAFVMKEKYNKTWNGNEWVKK